MDKKQETALKRYIAASIGTGSMATLFAAIIFASGRYPFFEHYYAALVVVVMIVAFAWGMVLLPVILSLIGPKKVKD
ncbi:MAG: hypothetical protein DHS20C11_20340 [Lysobacteraceae bacterium]|nr:MAG: hypothetical protein DHS20C11_20340 [Xanthomonadaceae bacterium]